MKKNKNTILNSDFDKCKSCIYFPDISASAHDYCVDKYGVKHRDIKYICKYDLHEINTRNNKCLRCSHG
jgi:hypothetical protein